MFSEVQLQLGHLFFRQRLTILSLCPPVENVVHIPKKILKTKPILNSCENIRKSVSKNLQYEGFFLNSRKSEESVLIFLRIFLNLSIQQKIISDEAMNKYRENF